jgi:hypothetical protein
MCEPLSVITCSSEYRTRSRNRRMRCCAQVKHCTAVVADLFDFWQHTLPRISGKSKLAEAIRYAVSRRAIFQRFSPVAALSSSPPPSNAPSATTIRESLRGQRRRRQTLAAIRQPAANDVNEQCRSIRASSDTSAYYQRLTLERNRSAYVMGPRPLTTSACRWRSSPRDFTCLMVEFAHALPMLATSVIRRGSLLSCRSCSITDRGIHCRTSIIRVSLRG